MMLASSRLTWLTKPILRIKSWRRSLRSTATKSPTTGSQYETRKVHRFSRTLHRPWTNFLERCKAEVRRIRIPRTWVNSVWWPGDDALLSRHRDRRRRRDEGRSYGSGIIRAFSVLPPRLRQPPLEVLRAGVQHPDHPVHVVSGEELLACLRDEAHSAAVLVAHADPTDQHPACLP